MSLSSNVPQPAPAGNVIGQQSKNNTLVGEQNQAGSNVNQQNQYGSLTYNQTGTGPGGVPLYTATETLNPTQQALFNTLQGTQGIAGKSAQDLLKGAGYGSSTPAQAIGDKTSGLTGQMLDSWWGANQPFLKTQTDQLDSTLRNQGLLPGTPGYDNALRSLRNSQGIQENAFLAQAQPTAFSEASSLYQMPASLASGLAALGQPGSINSALVQPAGLNINPTDIIGAYSNQESQALQAQNQKAQQDTAMWNTILSPVNSILGGWGRGSFGGGPGMNRGFF